MGRHAKRAAIGLGATLLASIPFLLCLVLTWKLDTYLPLYAHILGSIITFILYYVDKEKAKKDKWRIPELTLHLAELCCGWPGALIARALFHHKTKKVSFRVVFWGILFLHFALWVTIIIQTYKRIERLNKVPSTSIRSKTSFQISCIQMDKRNKKDIVDADNPVKERSLMQPSRLTNSIPSNIPPRLQSNYYNPRLHSKPFKKMIAKLNPAQHSSDVGLSPGYDPDSLVLQKMDATDKAEAKTQITWFREYDNIRYGDYVMTIEHCAHCHNHSEYTRHREEVFVGKGRQLKEGVITKYPMVNVYLKPISDSTHEMAKPLYISREKAKAQPEMLLVDAHRSSKLGAFEVQVCYFKQMVNLNTMSSHSLATLDEDSIYKKEVIRLHSRLLTNRFPFVTYIVNKLSEIMGSCDVKLNLRTKDQITLSNIKVMLEDYWSPQLLNHLDIDNSSMRKLPSPKWSRTRLEPEIGIFGERGHGHTRSLAAEEGRQVITPPSPTIKFKDDLEKVEIELPPPVKSESRATYDSERRKKQISNVYLKTGSHSKERYGNLAGGGRYNKLKRQLEEARKQDERVQDFHSQTLNSDQLLKELYKKPRRNENQLFALDKSREDIMGSGELISHNLVLSPLSSNIFDTFSYNKNSIFKPRSLIAITDEEGIAYFEQVKMGIYNIRIPPTIHYEGAEKVIECFGETDQLIEGFINIKIQEYSFVTIKLRVGEIFLSKLKVKAMYLGEEEEGETGEYAAIEKPHPFGSIYIFNSLPPGPYLLIANSLRFQEVNEHFVASKGECDYTFDVVPRRPKSISVLAFDIFTGKEMEGIIFKFYNSMLKIYSEQITDQEGIAIYKYRNNCSQMEVSAAMPRYIPLSKTIYNIKPEVESEEDVCKFGMILKSKAVCKTIILLTYDKPIKDLLELIIICPHENEVLDYSHTASNIYNSTELFAPRENQLYHTYALIGGIDEWFRIGVGVKKEERGRGRMDKNFQTELQSSNLSISIITNSWITKEIRSPSYFPESDSYIDIGWVHPLSGHSLIINSTIKELPSKPLQYMSHYMAIHSQLDTLSLHEIKKLFLEKGRKFRMDYILHREQFISAINQHINFTTNLDDDFREALLGAVKDAFGSVSLKEFLKFAAYRWNMDKPHKDTIPDITMEEQEEQKTFLNLQFEAEEIHQTQIRHLGLKLFKENEKTEWVEIGRIQPSEVKQASFVFNDQFNIEFAFESAAAMKIEVFMDNPNYVISTNEFTLHNIISSLQTKGPYRYYKLPITDTSGYKLGVIVVKGKEKKQIKNQSLCVDFELHELKAEYAYYKLSRDDNVPIFQSEVVKKEGSKHVFNSANMKTVADEKITFEVFQFDEENEDHKKIAGSDIQMEELFAEDKVKVDMFGDFNFSVTAPHKEAKITNATLLDYLFRGGFIKMLFAIDFTASNRNPSEITSLHYKENLSTNKYYSAIKKVGEHMERYDSDKQMASFGFGGVLEASETTMHCFALNENFFDPRVNSVEGVAKHYLRILEKVSLSGPTDISVVLQYAVKMVKFTTNYAMKKGRDQFVYSVLLLLTDGEINSNKERTYELITEASNLPISLILVGIGESNFAQMKQLEEFGKNSANVQRECVRFIDMKDVNNDVEHLRKTALKSLPEQVKQYFQLSKRELKLDYGNLHRGEENRETGKEEIDEFLHSLKLELKQIFLGSGYDETEINMIFEEKLPEFNEVLVKEILNKKHPTQVEEKENESVESDNIEQ